LGNIPADDLTISTNFSPLLEERGLGVRYGNDANPGDI